MSLHGVESLGLEAFLFSCSLKATVLLAVAWTIVTLAQRSSAAFRHLVWATAILASLVLPLLVVSLPAWHSSTFDAAARLWNASPVSGGSTDSQTFPAMIVNAAASASVTRGWAFLVLLIWALGFSLLMLRVVAGLSRLVWLSIRAKPLDASNWVRATSEMARSFNIHRPIRLRESGNPSSMPLTWGILRPVLLLPPGAAEWTALRRNIVLRHELAHVARCDWFFQICAELVRAVYWFQPLTWLAVNLLRRESEQACDDAVLRSGITAPDYADQLLDLARSLKSPARAWSSALAFVRRSDLERRFTAMLNPSRNHSSLASHTRSLVFIVGLLVLLPLSAVRLPAQSVAGKFSGTIYDISGAAVPNATVIMTDRKTNKITMTTSDAQGRFSFASLPAGEFELKALKRGFREYQAAQTLEAGRASTQDLTLQIGSVSDEVDVVAQGKAKGLPPAEPGGKTTRVRVGGDLQAPKLITKVQPIYPEGAKAAGSHGTVILHAVIGMDGRPLSLRVMNDQIDPELARAAIESVSQWRYSPTLLNGEPIEVDTTIQVNFTLLS